MAKEAHGDYAAYTTPGGVRFQHQGKLVSVNAVPPEVAQLLTQKLSGSRGQVVQPTEQPFPKPTPEQLAAIKAEQLAPKPGLEADPQKLADDAANAADRLSAADFDEPAVPVDPSPPEDPRLTEPVTTYESFPEVAEHPTEKAVRETKGEMSEFLEQVSIHSAPLEDMVQALYNRFGIYSVYLRKLPEADEINPLTGVNFTKYHLGIAYQAAVYAQSQGLLDLNPEMNRKAIDQGRDAAKNFQMDAVPETMGEARRANSFDFRTSVRANQGQPTTEIVHVTDENGIVRAVQRVIPPGEMGENNGAGQRYDNEEEERIVEPRFGKQVIRPNW